jgi:hypothetical protein
LSQNVEIDDRVSEVCRVVEARPVIWWSTVARLIGWRSTSILFALLCAMGTAPGCSRSSSDTVPDSLLGIWTTSDSRYARRFFDLRPHSVTFGLGENGQTLFPVSSVEWSRDYGQSVFTVHDEAEGWSQTSMAFYHPLFDNVLVFKNQLQTYWTRK